MPWLRRDPNRGTFGAFLRNFRQPGSLGWKAERYAANMLIRIRRRSDCCGNDGEPGC
jgi:hypothetical protein